MKIFDSVRLALRYGVTAVLISGCGGSQPPIGAPGAVPQSRAMALSSYKILHNFGANSTDGKSPQLGSLIDVNGTLYGTTEAGGKYGRGTVFSITTSGTEHVLHSFGVVTDGYYPYAGLIDVKGTLYGTTGGGGKNGYGTVFSVSTSGAEHVLYSFGATANDGDEPLAGLVDVSGTLYGTTKMGGEHSNDGTVFSISTSGKEHVVYSFGGSGTDGAKPEGGLIGVNGTLYGTTEQGGTHSNGTVFSVTTSGTEQVLHNFGAGLDGYYPEAALKDLNGTLYGTTAAGGYFNTEGTVFSISTSGSEQVVWNFGYFSNTDGSQPYSGVIDVNGALDGTTSVGGTYGRGAVVSVSTSGPQDQVLYSFGTIANDGDDPLGGLVDVKGTLYGMTYRGGKYNVGTVFALTP